MAIHGRITAKAAFIGALTALSISAFAAEPEAVPGEYVVKLKSEYRVTKASMQSLSAALGAHVKKAIPEDNIVVVQRPAIEVRSMVVKDLAQNPLVEIAEPNYIYRVSKTPDAAMFGNLWGLKNVGQSDGKQNGTPGVDIGAEQAWDITTGSQDIVVAVIDTGINYNHPDLKHNLWINQAEANGKPGVDDDGNGYVDDVYGYNFSGDKPTPDPLDGHGHGSHCSGTIGGNSPDGKGIVGVNWNVKIMAVKFLSDQGSGTLDGAIQAIDYATKMHVKLMSNSWGGGGASDTLKAAIQRASDAGILFVAAAGNDSANNDTDPHYPAAYNVPNVLAVAAIDNQGQLASFSNYGKKSVHVAAPGVNIYSSVLGNGYDSWSGTSMATPHVSGVAALLASHEPNLTAIELKERLMGTVKTLPNLRGKVATAGLVNAYNALTNQATPIDPEDPSKWASKTVNTSSLHPYAKKSNAAFELSVPGAKEISVYFSKFETETGYDKVTFYDKAGNKVAEMSGVNDDTYSPSIPGEYVKVVLTSDDSVEKYGFDITKVAYK
jgi:subtilisin family serine protease